ncbi:MAG: hypothetical protein ACRD19_06045 [Terriglobia bacterium]
MKVRALEETDIPALQAMHRAAGFDYEFPDFRNGKFEAIAVVADNLGRPLMAAAAERIVQLYLLSGEFSHPASKLHAIRLLHHALAEMLRAQGYREANAFLPPEIENHFGRRLMKSFGWVKNWASYAIRF